MPSAIDLHLHSNASDGALTPGDLVALAHRQQVRSMALTDHDSVEGLADARRAAESLGIRFVLGIELSVSWERIDVHVVGLGIDPGESTLLRGIAQQQEKRETRAIAMGERLARKGFPGALEGARSLAGEATVTRTHFARWMVSAGHVSDLQAAFKRYLRRGKPGYVACDWIPLEEAVEWIRRAGGQAVLAHPLRYPLNQRKLRRLIDRFTEAGGEGMEVVSGRQPPDQTTLLGQLCDWHGLKGSCGSDFHSPDQTWLTPGGISPFPRLCPPIWQGWPDIDAWMDPAA